MTRAEEIKQAALVLFAEKGYDATSIQHITASVRVKKATFYSHFQSKNELFLQLLKEQEKQIIEITEAALKKTKATDMKGLLFDVFDAYVRVNFSRKRLLFWKRAVMTQLSDDKELQAELGGVLESVNGFIASSLRGALKRICGDISDKCQSECMFMYFVFLQGYLDWLLITNKPDADHVKYAWESFWNGMQKFSL